MKEDQMDVENVGIMQGFMDDFDEVLKQALAEDESVGTDDDEYETGKMIDRTPGSPEILMNNLRGDMRSVDARREELADMVGYNAAMDTPDEVLALLQSSLAGGQAGGIEALMGGMGGAAGMTPPVMGGGAPPMAGMPDMGAAMAMPQAPMPTGQAPLQMANGGYVQSFADGSDEDGVTPFGMDTSSYFDPALRDYASEQTMQFLQQQPRAVPDLRASMEQRLPLYQDLIGGADSENMTQAQMLAALSQAAFNYAGNVDAQGRPLRGSQAARLAGAFAPVPGQMAKLASEQAKEGRAVKLAALQAAEKDVENVRDANVKLIESQRELWSDIAKASGSSTWGKGKAYWNIVNTPGLMARYGAGETSPQEDTQVESAIAEIGRLAQPSTVRYTDNQGRLVTETKPGMTIPDFVQSAIAARQQLGQAPAALPDVTQEAAASAGITEALEPVAPIAGAPEVPDVNMVQEGLRKLLDTVPEEPTEEELAQLSPDEAARRSEAAFAGSGPSTIWGAHKKAIGLGPSVADWMTGRLPYDAAGTLFTDVRQSRNTIRNLYPMLKEALKPEGERLLKAQYEDIQEVLDGLDLRYFDNVPSYSNRLISLSRSLYKFRDDALRKSQNTDLDIAVANAERKRYEDIDNVLTNMLGVPRPITTKDEFTALPSGQEYLIWDREENAWVNQFK
jgi:hypothetical protein